MTLIVHTSYDIGIKLFKTWMKDSTNEGMQGSTTTQLFVTCNTCLLFYTGQN